MSDEKPSTPLSICIPTFNRPSQLRALLEVLLPQAAQWEVDVLILDNASSEPVSVIMESFPEFRGLVKVVRHPHNIGANANIARCFELCATEWMWLLGDDDLPCPEALEMVLLAIKKVDPRCCMINWRSSLYPAGESCSVDRLEDLKTFCADRLRFSNLLFISSSVFRIPKMLPFLKEGYHSAYTCAPHLIMSFLAVAKGSSICDMNQFLVHWEAPATEHEWSVIYYLLGTTALADHQPLRGLSESVVRSAVLAMRGRMLRICKIILIPAFSCPRSELRFWSGVSFRMAASAAWWELPVFIMLGIGIRALGIIDFVRPVVCRMAGWQNPHENQTRT